MIVVNVTQKHIDRGKNNPYQSPINLALIEADIGLYVLPNYFETTYGRIWPDETISQIVDDYIDSGMMIPFTFVVEGQRAIFRNS